MKCAVIGSGSWGTALGEVLTENGHQVTIWGREESQVHDINENHRNYRYFPNEIRFDPALKATLDIEVAMFGAEVIIVSVPSQAIRDVCELMKPFLRGDEIIVNTAKGFDLKTKKRLSEVFEEVLQGKYRKLVSLIGPSLALEVAKKHLTCVCAVSDDKLISSSIAALFSNDYFRVYYGDDVVGSEIGVAMKNPIAICSGILAGLGYGDNARAALMTRGLSEMASFGASFGARKETYLGLTGLGDLNVTTSSMESRNFRAGLRIGKDDGVEGFSKDFEGITVEGVLACRLIHELSKEKGLYTPIIDALYSVLFEGSKPSQVVTYLMRRPLKEETF